MPTQTVDFSQLANVSAGDKLALRFAERAAADFLYLIAMHQAGVIVINPNDMWVVEAVAQTGDFDLDENRSLTVAVGRKWNLKFFEGRMQRPLESLELIPA